MTRIWRFRPIVVQLFRWLARVRVEPRQCASAEPLVSNGNGRSSTTQDPALQDPAVGPLRRTHPGSVARRTFRPANVVHRDPRRDPFRSRLLVGRPALARGKRAAASRRPRGNACGSGDAGARSTQTAAAIALAAATRGEAGDQRAARPERRSARPGRHRPATVTLRRRPRRPRRLLHPRSRPPPNPTTPNLIAPKPTTALPKLPTITRTPKRSTKLRRSRRGGQRSSPRPSSRRQARRRERR